MKLTTVLAPVFFGVHSGLPDKTRLELNSQEMATLHRAHRIIGEIRSLMYEAMGVDAFEDSTWYTAWIDDYLEEPIEWEQSR